MVLAHAQQAGVVRSDIDGRDLMQLIGAMCMSATLTEDQSERLLAVVLDGLRQPTAATTPSSRYTPFMAGIV